MDASSQASTPMVEANEEKHSTMASKPHVGHEASPAMKWPWLTKVYTSSTATLFTFALLFNASSISAGVPQIATEFGISTIHAITVFSLFIFGIAFAPLFTPHVSERIGRAPTYFVGTVVSSAFLIGASRSNNIVQLSATRFLAGFFQGPVVVLIEGTYADLWPAKFTLSYYVFIAASQYAGAATGAVVGGTVAFLKGWRWTQYVGLMINLLALVWGAGVRETYPRQLLRQRAKRAGKTADLMPAASGESFIQMASLTAGRPLIMLVSEPLVIGFAVSLSLNFGILFQFFILVPAVLKQLAKFDTQQAGFAFVSAYGGLALAGVAGLITDQVLARRMTKRDPMSIEHRMVSAIIGSLLMIGSLFWIGWTARPGYSFYVPIVGTAVYVWGSMMHLSACVSYLFDAYEPPSTLAALTACAVTRVLSAGWFVLFILPAVDNITGSWLLSVFGFIIIISLLVSTIVLVFGKTLRTRSRYADKTMMSDGSMSEHTAHE